MNKRVLAFALVAVAGCFRPPSIKARAAALRAKIAVVVPAPKIQIDPAALAALAAAAEQDKQRRAQPDPQPAPVGHVDHGRRDRSPPSVEPTIIRKTAPAATYILRGETIGGAKICTKWTSMDECNADCTRQIREGAMAALSKNAGFTKNCVCVEGKGC